MLAFFFFACAGKPEPEPADTGTCTTAESMGCLSVADETATCPDPASLAPEDLHDPYRCDDTVIRIDATETPSPAECSFLLNCDWQCCYAVTTEDCTSTTDCVV